MSHHVSSVLCLAMIWVLFMLITSGCSRIVTNNNSPCPDGISSTLRALIGTQELQEFVRDVMDIDVVGVNIATNKQSYVQHMEDGVDYSPNNLFSTQENITSDLYTIFSPFLSLLDNYQAKLGVNEVSSVQEVEEENAFLNKLLKSYPGNALYTLLYSKGIFPSKSALKSCLKHIWFAHYSRTNGYIDSSGFEHVFLGEWKSTAITGLHNWLQFYLLEQYGHLNYYGYTFYSTSHTNLEVLSARFLWDRYYKKVSSIFLNTSPYLEVTLYSLCYFMYPNKLCPVSAPYHIQTYDITKDGKKYVGSAYPVPRISTTPELGQTNDNSILDDEIQQIALEMMSSISDSDQELTNFDVNGEGHGVDFLSTLNDRFSQYIALLDNYEVLRGTNESKSQMESNEEGAFLNHFLRSSPGNILFASLQSKGLVSSKSDLKEYMRTLWFTLYQTTSDTVDSCGFEHIFVGEWDNLSFKVLGMHNWLTYYLMHSDERVQYWNSTGDNNTSQMTSISFQWDKHVAAESSILTHTTIELEFGLYTLCAVVRSSDVCSISNSLQLKVNTVFNEDGDELLISGQPIRI